MPVKSEKPLKMRGYKLTDETDALAQAIADALTESLGIKCSKTDAVRKSIEEKAATMGLTAKKKK